MRQYRGKRIDSGEMVKGENLINDCYIAGRMVALEGGLFYYEWWHKVDPKTVGQYTGIKTNDGMKIYKGDIIKVSYAGGGHAISISAVRFDGGRYVFEEKSPFAEAWTTSTLYSVIDHPNYQVEVVGNIHDNSELLEVGKDA